jgi:hypothetical protein
LSERPRTGRLDRESESARLAPTPDEVDAARRRPPIGRDPGRPGREHVQPRRRHVPAEPVVEEELGESTAAEERQVFEAVRSHRGD